ncbi:hypothetical protein B0H14DRAFT_3428679 [Mycena olivaceomarginata]|nr:hypothetical protein B0H14DRAFT_3428679 [Mycena olivaceomarginata]
MHRTNLATPRSEDLILILVIGATGAQGMAAIDGLLESRDGVPSPYKIRALTPATPMAHA